MKTKENYQTIVDAIKSYMDDDNVLQENKNTSAIALTAFLIHKTGVDIREGVELMEVATDKYLQIEDDILNGKLNTEFN